MPAPLDRPSSQLSARLKALQDAPEIGNDLALLAEDAAEEPRPVPEDFADLDISPAFTPLAAREPEAAKEEKEAEKDDYAEALTPATEAPIPYEDSAREIHDTAPYEAPGPEPEVLTLDAPLAAGTPRARRRWPVLAALAASAACAMYLGARAWPDASARDAGENVATRAPLTAPAPAAISFRVPLASADPALDGRSLAALLDGVSPAAPVADLPGALWQGETCASCHEWDRASLCERGDFYGAHGLPGKAHPYGPAFERAVRDWARGGCPG